MEPRIAVIYYSSTGNVHDLAVALAAGEPTPEVLAAARYQGARLVDVAAALVAARATRQAA